MSNNKTSVYALALEALLETVPAEKVRLTRELGELWQKQQLTLSRCEKIEPLDEAGLPKKLKLVAPRDLTSRKISNPIGHAAHIHAIAHIEFNAINLALDAVYRFQDMPDNYVTDWLVVAVEEAYHFEMLSERLADLGYSYGDFPAHNGLWQMAVDTRDDKVARMALVPRVMEARGLDVTPGMMKRFENLGDTRTVEILAIILRDEIGHVRTGSRWYYHLCKERDISPITTFFTLIDQYSKGIVKLPMNELARLEAGFSRAEIKHLKELGVNHATA